MEAFTASMLDRLLMTSLQATVLAAGAWLLCRPALRLSPATQCGLQHVQTPCVRRADLQRGLRRAHVVGIAVRHDAHRQCRRPSRGGRQQRGMNFHVDHFLRATEQGHCPGLDGGPARGQAHRGERVGLGSFAEVDDRQLQDS